MFIVVDDDGNVPPLGEIGHIAVRLTDPWPPGLFAGYYQGGELDSAAFRNGWYYTGDTAKRDKEGYFWFVGRTDDVTTSSGYRIGPAEIEDCLMKHPAVGMAAVIGIPDELRTQIVKAFIVLSPGASPCQTLEDEIKDFVKVRLAAHEYPRKIEFVEELPLTATGKIMRRELRQLEIRRKGPE